MVSSVAIAPTSIVLQLGGSRGLTATVTGDNGSSLSGRSVAWTSSSDNVASVTSAGVVTARGIGTATITATCEGKSGTATVSIPSISALALTGPSTIYVGVDASLTATATDAVGTVLTGRTIAWSSSNNAIVTVSAAGVARGASEGTATITASAEGQSATLTVTVKLPPPAARWLHAVVFDEAREQFLMFGGSDNAQLYNDLWGWSGTEWRRIDTPIAPPARDDMLLAYDATRQRVVLFGGRNALGPLTDTWEWDGTAWSQRATTGPTARVHFGGGFDRARNRTVVYGGQTPPGVQFTDTWEWDGTTWTQRATTRPTALDAATHAFFDSGRNALVMLVGSYSAGPSELWQWTGTAWTVIGAGPAISMPNAIVPMGASSAFMYASTASASTWRWNGIAWGELAIASPPRRFGAAMAYDPVRDRVVLFGGFDGAGYFNETWTFANGTWTRNP